MSHKIARSFDFDKCGKILAGLTESRDLIPVFSQRSFLKPAGLRLWTITVSIVIEAGEPDQRGRVLFTIADRTRYVPPTSGQTQRPDE